MFQFNFNEYIIQTWNRLQAVWKFTLNIVSQKFRRNNWFTFGIAVFTKYFTVTGVWKNEKTAIYRSFFSSNRFSVKFFNKTLIWRSFCKKTVCGKVVKNTNDPYLFFMEKSRFFFRQITTVLLKRWFDEIFFQWE